MTLNDLIANSHKEIAGSRAKNRLTVQISYAVQLIIDYYPTDFLVMMDYIEDVSVICGPDESSLIHLYQVKTKASDKQYLLSTVISDKWFQKLYNNAQKFGEHLGSATVVCNTDIVLSNSKPHSEVFLNERSSLNDSAIQKNINKIRSAIAKDQNVKESEVDLSKFYFLRSELTTKGHKTEAEYQFQKFLYEMDSDLQIATAKSIFGMIYDELDRRFNEELSEDCYDLEEIYRKKGFASTDIKSIVSCGLAIQIPTLDKLFSEYEITSIRDRKRYNSQYTQIKLDMYSNIALFVEFKKKLMQMIDEINLSGIDEMSKLLEAVYSRSVSIAPEAYSDEYYLKMLIMILIYKYCCGGENN